MAVKTRKEIVVEDLLSIAEGNIEDIVMGDYGEIIKLLGIEAAITIYNHYKGCNIKFPKHFYKPDYVIVTASKYTNRRDREKIAVICGYTSGWIERKVREYHITCGTLHER